MNARPPIVGVILAGGASRRMGTDKAFVEIDGRPMVVRVADALRAGGCDVVECQGGDATRLGALGLAVVVDDAPGGGPVPAIRQAVGRHFGTVVITACDLPDLDGAAVAAITDAANAGATAAVASADGRHLLAAFRSEAATEVPPAVWEAASFRALLDALDAVDVVVEARAVRNVNRPEQVDPSRDDQGRSRDPR